MNILNTGASALTKWQPSWKHHHTPRWFKKAVRRMAIKQGDWQPSLSTTDAHLPRLFDHWGSFLPAPEAATRKVATMPYQTNDDEAIAFAAELGCEVECLPTGPWHPAARLFIFSERADRLQS